MQNAVSFVSVANKELVPIGGLQKAKTPAKRWRYREKTQ
jgi:hypothetical protein